MCLYRIKVRFYYLDENYHHNMRIWTLTMMKNCFWLDQLITCLEVAFNPTCIWNFPNKFYFFDNNFQLSHWKFVLHNFHLLRKISKTYLFTLQCVHIRLLDFHPNIWLIHQCYGLLLCKVMSIMCKLLLTKAHWNLNALFFY